LTPIHGRAASHLDHISIQISTVLDPLAVSCRGRPVDQIQPLVADAWQQAFGSRLNEVSLSDTAVALRDGQPWCEALWTTAW
jgi:hypothetical protein